ncbi:pyridoxamine 5'-phosphate oxidase [Planomonospora sphaerica]|uniref:Pyridoxamine 5'-phosphate oxidase n=3 Tax=Planomonospora TaxID=1998 RepID=A0A171CFH1_9ACTN|nr:MULTISPECIES: PPOX class F420-dependent oxidoreductase [Planomonospora]GAT66629.1 pyridoxamine 5'-phosphate oxidase [Planomonospora sphaerica]GGK45627.1 PPOX class F420-dependent oxidoreductase [Planomonospora parontospora]GII06350.1 PPOX class F420-dependent oxidoreductase [Planomonospora parontospora subsp. parontospora]
MTTAETSAHVFTQAELDYLGGQRLGRLATVAPDGTVQNSPTGFHYDPATGTIDIYGRAMGATRKFRNVRANGRVAFVVDDLASTDPWVVRGVEIRGTAEAVEDHEPPSPYLSREVIRIRPERIISWGVDPAQRGMRGRDV